MSINSKEPLTEESDLKAELIFLLKQTKGGYLQPLQQSSENFKNSEECALAIVKQNGFALQFFNENIKQNKTIVMMAVNQNGIALKYAHENLKKDHEIVNSAVKQNKEAKHFAATSVIIDPVHSFFTPQRKVVAGAVIITLAIGATLGAIAFINSAATAPAILTATAIAAGGLTISTGGLALVIGIAFLGALGIGLMAKGFYDQYKKNKEAKVSGFTMIQPYTS